MGQTIETWWFDSRHGEFVFPSRSLDRRCGPPSPPFSDYTTPSSASLPRQSLCLNARATLECLKWTPDVAINWLTSAGTFRIKTGPEAGYRHWAFSVFLRHTGRITEQYLELVHSRFIPYSLQFFSHYSSHNSTLYSLNYRRRRYKTYCARRFGS